MGPRATAGSSAQRPLANTMKRAERVSTLLNAGALRTYRSPARMAWPIGSAPRRRGGAGRGQRYRTPSTPRKDAAFSANAAAGPAAATSSPPIAGPTARATLALAPLSSAASGSSSRGTSSVWTAWKQGAPSACPTARTAVRASSRFGVTPPAAVNTASAAEASSISVWLSSNSRRRSRMSPSAPAGMTRRKTGSVAAVCTRAICRALPPRSPISHCAPTVWAQVPVLATNWAIHRARNQVCRSGAQADGTAAREDSGAGVSRRTSTASTIPGLHPAGSVPTPRSGTRAVHSADRGEPALDRGLAGGQAVPDLGKQMTLGIEQVPPAVQRDPAQQLVRLHTRDPGRVGPRQRPQSHRLPEGPSGQVVQRQAAGVVRSRRVDDLVTTGLGGHGCEHEVGQVVDDDVGPERGARVLASCPDDRTAVALDVALPLDPCRPDRHGGDVRPGDGGVHEQFAEPL